MSFLQTDQNGDLSDEDVNQVLGLGANNSQQQRLALQMKLANDLRMREGTKGQVVPQGSVFIPSSPLTSAMDTFDRMQGIVAQAQGKKQGDQLDQDRQKGLKKFAQMWFNRNKNQQTQTPGDEPMDEDQNEDNEDTANPANY